MSELPRYEAFIQRHFPKWGAQRAAYRAAGAMASYRGSITTRLDKGFASGQWSYKGGTLTERHSLAEMRDRGRKAYRDNPIAAALVDVEAENIAPTFTVHGRTGNSDFNSEAEDKWPAFLLQADITERYLGDALLTYFWKTFRIDGDGGIKFVDKFAASKLQHLPGDLIMTPYGKIDPAIIDGVQVDGALAPQGLWVRTLDVNGKDDFAFCSLVQPNRDGLFIAHYDAGVPLAVRGMTCFGKTFPLMDQLDGYIDAVSVAARLQAAIGLIFKDENPAKAMTGFPTEKNSQGKDTRVITIENGSMRFVGKEGETVGVNPTQPMQQTPEFIRALNRIIANAFGMPIEIAARDLSQVNFSGGRIGLLAYYRRCRLWQSWFIVKVLSPIYRWWISREVKRGRFVSPVPVDYWAHQFSGRHWDYNDPVTEMQALMLELAAGIGDEFSACAVMGRDYEDVLIRRQEARKLREKYQEPAPALPNTTRDTRPAVTAVDANGNPLTPADTSPLNGIQISAAIDVLTKLIEKTIDSTAAVELLSRLGISPDRAKLIAASAQSRTEASPGDRTFQRDILKSLLTVPAAREAVFNATHVQQLISQSGLPPRPDENGKPLSAPFIPVVAPAGPLVSGEIITNFKGEFVGGDVEDNLPEPAPSGAPRQDQATGPALAPPADNSPNAS
jgi:capsid protein